MILIEISFLRLVMTTDSPLILIILSLILFMNMCSDFVLLLGHNIYLSLQFIIGLDLCF